MFIKIPESFECHITPITIHHIKNSLPGSSFYNSPFTLDNNNLPFKSPNKKFYHSERN